MSRIQLTTPGYLCCEQVLAVCKKDWFHKSVPVTIYSAFTRKVCPHPLDPRSCENCEHSLAQGVFLSSDVYYVAKDDLPGIY